MIAYSFVCHNDLRATHSNLFLFSVFHLNVKIDFLCLVPVVVGIFSKTYHILLLVKIDETLQLVFLAVLQGP